MQNAGGGGGALKCDEGLLHALDSRRVRAEKRKKEQENLELDLRQKTSRVNMLEDMEKNM